MNAISKEFPGVRALDGVTMDLDEGEFHALVGENGAGKSTLMKILSGVHPHGSYGGTVKVRGAEERFSSVSDAAAAGIAIIFQELSLVKELTVGENIFLGREPSRLGVIDWPELHRRANAVLSELNVGIDSRARVSSLGIGQQQLVEIAKALSQDARILVLDEPTAALTESEVEALFEILARLKSRGVGMIYISHRLDEVFRMSDRITVLRDGRTVDTRRSAELSVDKVIAMMVGREVGEIFPSSTHSFGDTVMKVSALTACDPDDPSRKVLDGISFEVRAGEVLGIAGLMGAGRSELLMTIFGAWRGRRSGAVEVGGRKVRIGSPADAIAAGLGFVTEDRKRFGLLLEQTIRENMVIAALKRISGRIFTHKSRETAAAASAMASLKVKAGSPSTVARALSGGNQQKVVLGKWLLADPKVLLLDEPTRGIDVGAKQEIYAEVNRLAREGLAIVMVSSELPEVLGLSDRILVLHEGKIAAEFSKSSATPEKVMAAATGSVRP